jgi:hypothetical protein
MSPSCARSHVVGKYLTTKAYTAMVETQDLVVNFSSGKPAKSGGESRYGLKFAVGSKGHIIRVKGLSAGDVGPQPWERDVD